ncbi:MAG: hypothetical protein R3F22_08020 [Lysobacteraceae bacterium]
MEGALMVEPWICMALALVAVVATLGLRARAALGADEGYLWFGVQQVLKGRLPHRDFKSYEPGRYLWSAPLTRFFGGRLLGVRVSSHLFFALALGLALMCLRGLGTAWPGVILAAVVLAAWSHPQHKQYEHGWLLLIWSAFALLVQTPGESTAFQAGLVVGLALFFGFNLALYASAALFVTVTLTAWLGLVPLEGNIPMALLLGTVIGVLPFALMLFSAGFARHFVDRRITSVLARGAANLSLSRPWPWRSANPAFQGVSPTRRSAFQWLFLIQLLLPIGVLLAIVAGAWLDDPVVAGMLSAASLGLFVFHHAASRADASHIAQSAAPVLLVPFMCFPVAMQLLLALLLLWLIAPFYRHRPRRAGSCPDAGSVGSDYHAIVGNPALLAEAVRLCADQPEGAPCLFAAPTLPWLYAVLGRDAPVYDTFCVHPASAHLQEQMIGQLQASGAVFAMVSNARLDGRDDLRFTCTHPIVWDYLNQHFQLMVGHGLGEDIHVFRRCAQSIECQGPA